VKLLIIDCRFDYEFQGGHIKNALNINTPQDLEDYFLKNKAKIEELMAQKVAIIFHCEFSQKRGPKLFRTLRELDRNLNIDNYPQMFFPEMYILEGGYKDFQAQFPGLCEGSYQPMVDKNFKDDCKEQFGNNKKLHKQYSFKDACKRLID
jgi:rhodanese-related sulfurtransferase